MKRTAWKSTYKWQQKTISKCKKTTNDDENERNTRTTSKKYISIRIYDHKLNPKWRVFLTHIYAMQCFLFSFFFSDFISIVICLCLAMLAKKWEKKKIKHEAKKATQIKAVGQTITNITENNQMKNNNMVNAIHKNKLWNHLQVTSS